ncbi:MAG: Bsp6I family type II restriction endonuclease [Patescibacteria group bacterium]
MKIIEHKVKVFGTDCILKLMDFDKTDQKQWKILFDSWKKLKMGLKKFESREPNLPEGLSEVAFCIYSGSKRFLEVQKGQISASFDTYNLKTGKAEQIKATSVEEDLTSFGPASIWDDLYFLDFFNNGKLDGAFDVYKIPNNLIYSAKVNKNQTLKQQQKQKRRPRFSIKKKIVNEFQVKPIERNIKVWEI